MQQSERVRRHDDMSIDGATAGTRADLETVALALCGENQRQHVRLMSDRQIHELVLRRLIPSFNCTGRSDDGVRAGFEEAMRAFVQQQRQQRAADQRAQRPDVEAFFRDQGVLAEGQRLDAEIVEIEHRRQNAWRPKTAQAAAPARSAERDVDAELRELEQQRQNAWRKPPAA